MNFELQKKDLQKQGLTITVGIILLIIILIGGYQLTISPAQNKVLLPVKGCPLHLQSCSAKLPDGGEIQFDVSPKTPSPTEILQLTAYFKNINPQSVRVKFEGKTMKMGYLQYDLKQKLVTEQSIQFSAKGSLSVCIRGVMKWIVAVTVEVDDTLYEVPFEMETHYNPAS